jgi:hypothetical protein
LSTLAFIVAVSTLVAVAAVIRSSRFVVAVTLALVALLTGSLIAVTFGVDLVGYVALITLALIAFIYFPWWPGAD